MKCPYSTAAQWIIAGLSIISAIIFRMNFDHHPIYMRVFIASFLIYVACVIAGIAFRKSKVTAIISYIFWFIYTFSLGFEVTIIFAEFYFK